MREGSRVGDAASVLAPVESVDTATAPLERFWLTSPGYHGPYSLLMLLLWLWGGVLTLVLSAVCPFVAPTWTAVLFVAWVAVGHWPMRLTVGSDGILLSWLGMRQFVSYRELDLVAVWSAGPGAILSFRSGIRVVMRTAGHRLLLARDAHTARVVSSVRTNAGFAQGAEGCATSTALLVRRGGTVSAWLRQARTAADHCSRSVPQGIPVGP